MKVKGAARKGGAEVQLSADTVVVTLQGRTATFAAHFDAETDALVVQLDSVATWDAPHDGDDIDVTVLQRMTDAIEAKCDAEGLDVEFE